MSHQVLETDTYPTSIQVPDPGDGTYPEVVPVSIGQLASRTKYLDQTLKAHGAFMLETSVPEITDVDANSPGIIMPSNSRAGVVHTSIQSVWGRVKYTLNQLKALKSSIALGLPGISGGGYYGGTPQILGMTNLDDWITRSAGSAAAPYILQNVANTAPVRLALPWIPVGSVITQVNILCSSPSSHSGSIVGMTMPAITLYKASVAGTGTPSTVAVGSTATDSSANATDYENTHYISITGLDEEVASPQSSWYFVNLRGESGGNAQNASFRVYLLNVSVTTP